MMDVDFSFPNLINTAFVLLSPLYPYVFVSAGSFLAYVLARLLARLIFGEIIYSLRPSLRYRDKQK